jgi:hypothetical protein
MAGAIGVDQAVQKRIGGSVAIRLSEGARACEPRYSQHDHAARRPQARAVEETHASAPVEPPTRDQGVCSQEHVGF